MEIISSKQEEESKATHFIVNILKLHTNPKVLIQEFVWSFEIYSKNIYLLTKSIIIRGNYIRSRNYIHFKELISSFNEAIFIQGNIFLQGKHIHSGKLYQFKEYIHLRNICSFKFMAICSFKEAIFIQQRCNGAKLWNTLPANIRKEAILSYFKLKIKTHLATL